MHETPLRGHSFVISGAQGAGKTALLDAIADHTDVPVRLCESVPEDAETQLVWEYLAQILLTGRLGDLDDVRSHKIHESEKSGVAAVGTTSVLVKGDAGFSYTRRDGTHIPP